MKVGECDPLFFQRATAQEVEEAVAEHPAIAEVGVIGVHDLIHGENVRAYVTLKDGAPLPASAWLVAKQRLQ